MKEDQRFGIMKKYVNVVLDIVLGMLAILILIFMIRQLIDIGTFINKPMTPKNLSVVMQEVWQAYVQMIWQQQSLKIC